MNTSVLYKHDRISAVYVTADVFSLHDGRVRIKLIIQLGGGSLCNLYRSVTGVLHVCYCYVIENTEIFHCIFFPIFIAS